jgi:hypothetical protein
MVMFQRDLQAAAEPLLTAAPGRWRTAAIRTSFTCFTGVMFGIAPILGTSFSARTGRTAGMPGGKVG